MPCYAKPEKVSKFFDEVLRVAKEAGEIRLYPAFARFDPQKWELIYDNHKAIEAELERLLRGGGLEYKIDELLVLKKISK